MSVIAWSSSFSPIAGLDLESELRQQLDCAIVAERGGASILRLFRSRYEQGWDSNGGALSARSSALPENMEGGRSQVCKEFITSL